jgi:hypothetical protein
MRLICDRFIQLRNEKAAQASTTERLFCYAVTLSRNLLSRGRSGERQKNAIFSEKSNYFFAVESLYLQGKCRKLKKDIDVNQKQS